MQLTRSHGGSVHNSALSWSPDGTKIVFIRYGHSISRWYVMNADGTAVTQFAPGLAFGAAWAAMADGREPDLERIASERARLGALPPA